LAVIVLAFGERGSTEYASPIQAAQSTSYSTWFSTQASTKISYGSVATATSTAYVTIYSTGYYRQSDANGPLVRVKGQAAITFTGYTASVSATVENLFDDYIFKVSVTFQVMFISKDGRRIPTSAGAKLLFDGGIWPGGSRSASDVVLIQYPVGALWAIKPPYLPTSDYEMEFAYVDFSTYPFKSAVAATTIYSMRTETHIVFSTLTYVSSITQPEPSIGVSPWTIIMPAVIAIAILVTVFLLNRRRRPALPRTPLLAEKKEMVLMPTVKPCVRCGFQLPVDAEYCSECGQKQG